MVKIRDNEQFVSTNLKGTYVEHDIDMHKIRKSHKQKYDS